jgi:site-specific DNA-methyltransferase (adenine-specific)
MSARLIISDVRDALRSLDPGSVDLVVTSPPFLNLRSYLPADDPDKAKEIGSEATPADFIDTMLDVVELCRRVLAPHGSLVFEIGDTMSGSGGAGGDYNEGGFRDGQPKFSGSALSYRKTTNRNRNLAGWPLDKSLCGIPDAFALSLEYGWNMLRPERKTERWIVRNKVVWARPNPPVGDDGDKFRRSTSYLTIATLARDRYWNADAVRVPGAGDTSPRNTNGPKALAADSTETRSHLSTRISGDTRPLYDHFSDADLDYYAEEIWKLPTQPYKGSHYATYPEALVVPLVQAMCPEQVCTECGEPRRPIVERESIGIGFKKSRENVLDQPNTTEAPDSATRTVVGFTDCGHASYRPGVVLDPFAGSGTTLQVATRLGRDAIGIDLDRRNVALIAERVGMFLTDIEDLSTREVAS